MNKFSGYLNKFLFSSEKRATPHVFLGIFLALAIGTSLYIYFNADSFVSLPSQDLFSNKADIPEEGSSVDVVDPPDSTGQSSKKTSTDEKNSSVGSSTTGDNNAGGSTPVAESVSAFVAFYADNQSDSDVEDATHLSVVNKIIATGANPVFHAGDLMEDGTEASLNRFNNIAGSLLSQRLFYGALGNNDRNGSDTSTPSPLYLANFNFPGNERWYSVNTGNLHLIVLDSAFASASQTQLDWLTADLQSAASKSRITGIMYHHPAFTSSIESYLINYGVDFVLSGHIHTYTKTLSGGVHRYTLNGGASLGYSTLRVYSTYAEFRAYNTNGDLIDSDRITNR